MNARVDPAALPAAPMPGPEASKLILAVLRRSLGPTAVESWLGRLELDEVSGGVARASLPTKFLRSWCAAHHHDAITAAVREMFPGVRRVELEVRSSARLAPPAVVAAPSPQVRRLVPAAMPAPLRAAAPAPASDLPRSPIEPRLTFATFQVGESNRLTHAAAAQVAERQLGTEALFNPLYVHGAVGLGKTHLLQAIAHEATALGRRAVYLTAEKFMYAYVVALKAMTLPELQDRLRDVDILLIDDAQFLQGKSIRQEFCATLSAMVSSGSQLVIAADRPPHDLEHLDDRLRSRLASGLTVAIEAPGLDLRARMLAKRAAALGGLVPGFALSAEVVAYVASVIQTNGRDLDGALNRLLAHASLTQTVLDVAAAELALRDLVRTREPKRVRIEDIQKMVAAHFDVRREDILSSRRTAKIVRPRQVAMYLAKTLTPRSLPEIGRRFGGRDHTTVLHAVRKIDRQVGEDRALLDEVDGLRRMLAEG